MALCDNLKRLRAEHGLSQKEMAEKLDLNARTYASYERAEREPSTAIILKICQLFGISSDELLGNCKDEKSTPIVNDRSAVIDRINSLSDSQFDKLEGYLDGLLEE